MKAEALTQAEFSELRAWSAANQPAWPENIQSLVDRMLALYQGLSQDKKNAADVLATLRRAMGILPSSESGKQLQNK